MLKNHGILVPALAVLAACGTSRSTRSSGPCSATQSIVDKKVSSDANTEKYDPSAVLLLFKATSNNLAIESRCNARLVNKLLTKHKAADGSLTDITAPVDFGKLTLQIEKGENNLELHTSAHCFFRVWDSRVSQQVANNPAIAIEPVKSLLANQEVRYELYRSMLTTPQTIVGYLPDGSPVELKYTLQTTPLYERFFTEIDKLGSSDLKKTVGQEFSKSSVILDEFVTHECNADDKVERRSFDPKVTAQVKDVSTLAPFAMTLLAEEQKGGRAELELMRTRTLASGRHKLCFSQTDMVVAPIQIVGNTTDNQRKFISEIETRQSEKSDIYTNLLKSFQDNYLNASGSSTPTTLNSDFVFKLKDVATPNVVPLKFPADLQSCSFGSEYPGFLLSEAILQRIEKSYYPRVKFEGISALSFATPFAKLFPNLVVDDAVMAFVRPFLESRVQKALCELVGFDDFNASLNACVIPDSSAVGRCPLPGTVLSAVTAKHEQLKKSIHISSVSPIHMLKRLREESPIGLTLPFSVMRDFVEISCQSAGGNSCGAATHVSNLKGILDVVEKIPVTTGSGQTIYPAVTENFIRVTNIDQDHQFVCTRESANSTEDQTSALFSAWSDESKRIVLEGIPAGSSLEKYRKTGTRHIFLKCTAAGLQRLYNSQNTYFGIGQYLKYVDVSMVRTDALGLNGRIDLSNAQIVQTGQPMQIPFARIFLNESQSNESSTDIAARLLAGPHFQMSYCSAQQRTKSPDGSYQDLSFCKELDPIPDLSVVGAEFQKIPAHFNFTTQLPAWLPEQKKAKYGPVAFPSDNYSSESSRYFFTAGDSGTTVSGFGLFPLLMLSTVQDVPVSGGLAVIPSKGEQQVQTSKNTTCR